MKEKENKELWRILKNAEWNLSNAIANPDLGKALLLDFVLYDLRIAISKLEEKGGSL